MNSVLNCGRLQAKFGLAQSDWRDELQQVLDKLDI
jgi:dTDP-4-dehydrorhamnose reductase